MKFIESILAPVINAFTDPAVSLFDTDAQPALDPWGDDAWLAAGIKEEWADQQQPDEQIGPFKFKTLYEGDKVANKRAVGAGWTPDDRRSLVDLARTQLGTPYVWGASDPGDGFDCSGFTRWVLAQYGIETPHVASSQQQQFRSVEREDLAPGDLVFFNYGRKAAGQADHVGLYIGNGMMIDASSSEGELVERPVDWSHFIGGGATGIMAAGAPAKGGHRKRTPLAPSDPIPQALAGLLDQTSTLPFALYRTLGGQVPSRPRASKEPSGDIESQLYKGFMAAGRPDLAKMVGTKDFHTWVQAESGWNPGIVSQYFEGHGRNYGLFQFWEGHPWTARYVEGDSFTASPYRQAMMVARHFNLTPADISRYAEQIRNGSYGGWG